ncbi:disintegrin and metalloproteinase domain-containing protein 8 isoform X3 [Ursus americanus]|uniref:disintegrin and metalloproteinase domain-containing protein 8 isoform X3 n=1 Tax=Ursus americanus TaxID=9643 RepID=UPI001E679435|nr:disintegrin and metalloproteinase domain-containing protein 8 isoform X3 [Ursus americanus]
MRVLGLQLLALCLQVAAPSTLLPHVEQYEVVWPQRLSASRARRALPSHLDLYPESVSFVLGTQGHNFTLHLRKNRDLVGSGYTETYKAANGSQVVEQQQRQGHCFYQGHVEGHHHSAASLSTCAGLRGFFRAGSDVHLIEPLDGGGEEGQHALYRVQHLQQKAGTCGVSNTSLEKALGPRISAAFRPRNWPVARDTRYVELYVVTDSAEFRRLGSRAAVRSRVMEVVNHVDKLYQELNFRVVLVGLEMWNQEDQIHVSSNPDTTLDNFLRWRTQNLVGRHQHDNAQLITGVEFTGTTVGLAKVSAMCSQDSGAVNQDHNLKNPIGVASTMAHEMGHNLGMDHDENIQGCYCPVPREGGGCIMAASIGAQFPKMFSQCSRADLEMFVEKPRTACLANAPDPGRLVGDPVCGNRFVERGEQCDCGPPQACRDPCCNATTCQLAAGAQCAQGSCCHDCRVTPAGELCRPPKDACDLEEYCDGQQPACPEDVFQENGTPCPGGYCYNGVCPTLAQKCRDLWGLGEVHRLPWKHATPTTSYRAARAGSPMVPAGSTSVASCTVRADRSPQSGVPAPSPPPRALARLSSWREVRDMSRCRKAPSVVRRRFAGKDSASSCKFTDPGTAPPSATAVGCATTRESATATRAGRRPTAQSRCPIRAQGPGAPWWACWCPWWCPWCCWWLSWQAWSPFGRPGAVSVRGAQHPRLPRGSPTPCFTRGMVCQPRVGLRPPPPTPASPPRPQPARRPLSSHRLLLQPPCPNHPSPFLCTPGRPQTSSDLLLLPSPSLS